MESSREKNNEVKKPTPHDNAIPRVDLDAQLAALRQQAQQFSAQEQQAHQMATQAYENGLRVEGAIQMLSQLLQPAPQADRES